MFCHLIRLQIHGSVTEAGLPGSLFHRYLRQTQHLIPHSHWTKTHLNPLTISFCGRSAIDAGIYRLRSAAMGTEHSGERRVGMNGTVCACTDRYKSADSMFVNRFFFKKKEPLDIFTSLLAAYCLLTMCTFLNGHSMCRSTLK